MPEVSGPAVTEQPEDFYASEPDQRRNEGHIIKGTTAISSGRILYSPNKTQGSCRSDGGRERSPCARVEQ